MKESLPKLKDVFVNDKLYETGICIVMMCEVGYTMDDFKEYVDEMMTDEDTREQIKVMAPLFEYTLKELKRSEG